jgi:CRISPR/Cas system CSM-associated protein Csm3 (group 7 of RAMP superfamily)
MIKHTIEATYALETTGPLHVGTGHGSAGLHRRMLRDMHGVPYIPGTTVKGRARYAAIRICDWLGLPVFKDTVADVRDSSVTLPNGPHAKRDFPSRIFGSAWWRCTLRFSDARAEPPPRETWIDKDTASLHYLREHAHGLREVRMGAARSRHLGTISQGRLYRSEVAPPGMIFRGSIRGHLACRPPLDGWSAEILVLWLSLHLMVEDGIGANKSAGSGKLTWEASEKLEMKIGGQIFVPPDDDTFTTLLTWLNEMDTEGEEV